MQDRAPLSPEELEQLEKLRPELQPILQGVIAGGNTNFYEAYCLAGDIISRKCGVPLMYRFELMGTPEDVTAVREGLEGFWA